MSLPAWKRRALERSKLANFEREQRSPFLRELDTQEVFRMTGITTNASQIVSTLKARRTEMIDKQLAKYYACKLAVQNKRGDYGRFMAEVAIINAEERAVNAALNAGHSAIQIEKLSDDLLDKVGKIEATRNVDVNGLALPAKLKAEKPAPAKKSSAKPAPSDIPF